MKKKLFFTSIFLICINNVFSQTDITDDNFSQNAQIGWLESFKILRDGKQIGAMGTDGINKLQFFTGSSSNSNTSRLTIDPNGKIGIGISSPLKTLHIFNENSYEAGIIESPNLGGSNLRFIDNTGNAIEMGIQNGDAVIRTNNTIRFISKTDSGNIGIGTVNPGDWKLAVNGKIRAKEIKVETGWSDFVFYDNYQLATLKEVETHIKENGHLKDIPSAKEVKKNGIFLGEMDSKLLQKIEELTLYTIQQQKEIENLKKENNEFKLLNKKLLELQKRLEKLEQK